MIVENAPAKINLALHVVGQRPDGYHELQTLVTFAGLGDRLTFSAADTDRLSMSGRFVHDMPQGDGPADNLVIKARDLLRHETELRRGLHLPAVHIHLEKNLPVASGIGGGSADAAATLRGLNQFWGNPLSHSTLWGIALEIGADVPMCLESQPLFAEGIGEMITPRPDLPRFGILMANAMIKLPTALVFSRLARKSNPRFSMPPAPASTAIWLGFIAGCRNDLQDCAEALEPAIGETLHLLAGTAPLISRMSGSGATCFALYDTVEQARTAGLQLEARRPDWYFAASETISQMKK